MAFPLPTVTDPEVQQALDQIGLAFPLDSQQLQVGAATKLHSAQGSTLAPTTTSTANPPTVVLNEMTITADFGGNPIVILFTGLFNNTAGNTTRICLHDLTAGTDIEFNRSTVAATDTLVQIQPYTPAAGTRTIQVRWSTSAGTATAAGVNRTLVIVELRR